MSDLAPALVDDVPWQLDQGRLNQRIDRAVSLALRAGRSAEHIATLVAERDGGGCPRCEAPWRAIAVNVQIGPGKRAEFVYYDPACSCYPRCRRCGASLHREATSVGVDRMDCACGWKAYAGERQGRDNKLRGGRR